MTTEETTRLKSLCHALAKLTLDFEAFCEKTLPHAWEHDPRCLNLKHRQATLVGAVTDLLGSPNDDPME